MTEMDGNGGKEGEIKELTGEQRRQTIDAIQAFEAWRSADRERRRRFLGSMRWAPRGETDYLLRKIGARERSLGPRSSETEKAFADFFSGRERNAELLAGLSRRLDEMAPVNRAMGLGRVPRMAARILRDMDERELLGRQLVVVGTNALFAYEARAGVHVGSGLLATGDIDMLYDARRRLSLAGSGLRETGLIGILQQLDRSFSIQRRGDYRAVNRDGYLVDLIRPQTRDPIREAEPAPPSRHAEDFKPAPIEGLQWLINTAGFQAIAIAEDGYPVTVATVDPRAFALHKLWIAGRPDRDPVKKVRDRQQASVTAELAERYLGLSFNDTESLSAIPERLRAAIPELLGDINDRTGRASSGSTRPAW